MVRQFLVILLLALLTISAADAWRRFRVRVRIPRIVRRPVVHHHTHHHTNTNNCLCNAVIHRILYRLKKVEKKLGRRDVADLLDLEEDYPGLDNLLDHLNTKRDGSIDKEALTDLLKRSSSSSSSAMTNICHCGRSIVDDFNMKPL